jgi:predicted nucleic acid-binding protein
MNWVVDTCLIIDVLDNDPLFGADSAQLIDNYAKEGLSICPISYIELAPTFLGDRRRQDEFLSAIGITHDNMLDGHFIEAAYCAWNQQVMLKRSKKAPRRPIADILIGAFALCEKGILTRNPSDFKRVFPKLKVITP